MDFTADADIYDIPSREGLIEALLSVLQASAESIVSGHVRDVRVRMVVSISPMPKSTLN